MGRGAALGFGHRRATLVELAAGDSAWCDGREPQQLRGSPPLATRAGGRLWLRAGGAAEVAVRV
jgi:hypothetical protein